jgi:hypothetical protein
MPADETAVGFEWRSLLSLTEAIDLSKRSLP